MHGLYFYFWSDSATTVLGRTSSPHFRSRRISDTVSGSLSCRLAVCMLVYTSDCYVVRRRRIPLRPVLVPALPRRHRLSSVVRFFQPPALEFFRSMLPGCGKHSERYVGAVTDWFMETSKVSCLQSFLLLIQCSTRAVISHFGGGDIIDLFYLTWITLTFTL